MNFRSLSFSTEGATYNPRATITLGIGPNSGQLFIFQRFWATVCKTVRLMLSDRCLSCPVCL